MSTISVNHIEGKGTPNSVTVRGENANNTNLQQGLAKVWASVTVSAISDSLNVSGLTDHSAGTFTFTYATSMASQNYSFQHLPCEVGARQLEVYIDNTSNVGTGSIKVFYGYTSNTNGGITVHDHSLSAFAHHGALA